MSQIEVDKVIPQSGTALQVGESGDTITIPAGATITNNGTATGFDTDTNDKVKVSANDTTAGFLNGKLVAGTNISLTEGTDGGNETLTAALSGTIATAQIADDAVTLAKMAPGTDGNIISYDASGNPVAVATGSAGQVLTSAGAGAPPTFAAAPASSGRILQIVSSSDTTDRSTSSTSFGGNPSGMLSINITPASTSSTILLSYYGNGYIDADAGSMFFTIYRDSSDLGNSNKGLTNIKNAGNVHTSIVPTSITTFDLPNTTSQVTYTLTIRAGSGTAHVNYNGSRSRLTAFEIGA